MKDELDIDRSTLTDTDLRRLLERRGVDRRTLLKALGIGSAAALLGSETALAGGDVHGPAQGARIHPFLGYTQLPKSIDPTSYPLTADHEVQAIIDLPPEEACGPFHFDPVGLHVEPGDVVHWHSDTDFSVGQEGPTGYIAGDHTITAYSPVVSRQRRIPEGATPFSSPMIGKAVSWYYRFETPGVYDVYCGPHEEFGMVMRIVVGDGTDTEFGDGYDPNAPPGPTNPPLFDQVKPIGAAPGVLDALDPDDIVADGSIEWDTDLCPVP